MHDTIKSAMIAGNKLLGSPGMNSLFQSAKGSIPGFEEALIRAAGHMILCVARARKNNN